MMAERAWERDPGRGDGSAGDPAGDAAGTEVRR